MRAGVSAAIVTAYMLGSGAAAWAACPAGPSRDCVDLNLAAKISQDIVAAEPPAAAPKRAPAAAAQTPYTGPTLGVSDRVRRAPEIGYRWSIN